jgi:hypothetical protein
MWLGYRVTTERIYVTEAAAPPADAAAKERPVDVLRRVDAMWLKVEAALWYALQPFAEARVAVAQALEDMGPVPAT